MNEEDNQTGEGDSFGPLELVIIQATSFCNLDCDYCYLDNRQLKHTFDLNLIEPIFRAIFTSPFLEGEFTVCWHAGEPLAVPLSFYETAVKGISHLQQELKVNCEVRQTVQTNATLITQSWCDLFLESQFTVGLSIDGPAFLHDTHRKTRKGLGTHKGVMKGVELLQKNNIPTHVICVLTRESLDYPDQIFDFFLENNLQSLGFNVEELEGIHRHSSLTRPDTERAFREFMSHFWDRVAQSNGAISLREFEKVGSILCGSRGKLRSGLTHPFSILNFDYQGNFSTFDPEMLGVKTKEYGDFFFGNIRSDSLVSICETDKFKRVYGDILEGVKLCSHSCQYFNVCGGGSACNKYWENGTFRSSETMTCRLYEQIITDVVLEKLEAALGLPTSG